MNLHGIVSGVVGAVNPRMPITVRISDGSTTLADGTRTPKYLPPKIVQGQIQPLSTDDIRQLDGLNISGAHKAIYISGNLDGLVRAEKKGGDLIALPDGSEWLVATVLEDWPDWVKVAVTLQRPPFRSAAAGIVPAN